MADKITDGDKKSIEDAANKALRFLESSPNAELQELQQKKKELEAVLHPIMQKVYAQGQPGRPSEMPNQDQHQAQAQANVDDVDWGSSIVYIFDLNVCTF